jgi:hypothetical protein
MVQIADDHAGDSNLLRRDEFKMNRHRALAYC